MFLLRLLLLLGLSLAALHSRLWLRLLAPAAALLLRFLTAAVSHRWPVRVSGPPLLFPQPEWVVLHLRVPQVPLHLGALTLACSRGRGSGCNILSGAGRRQGRGKGGRRDTPRIR